MKKKNENKSSWSLLLAIALGLILQLNPNSLYAQGNLQFNQVLYIISGTVPVGKTWKIERILNVTTNTQNIIINGVTIGQMISFGYGISGASGTSMMFTGPIWLPAGATIASSGDNLRWNIIEFNIVP